MDTDPDGGYLSIADANGTILDELSYPKQHTDVSWGRTSDGGSAFGYFIKSTHDRSNNGSTTASTVVAEPTFSLKGGFYSDPVTVSIYCKTEEAKIYYTLDGSDPTPLKSLYTGTPIQIDFSRPLRAKAFAEGYLNGTIATATYMINERIPDLPVFFLTTDSVNLYNDTIGIYCVGTNGIYVPGSSDIANFARDWARPAHLEFLDKNKSNYLDQAIGIAISGNATRRFDQKSLKINSGKKYGKSRFDYPLFSEREGCRIKSFLLRNGGQNNGPGFIKDGLLESMTDVIKEDHQAYETSVVYINGKYWGMLNIRERNNKDYIYSNYGYSDTDIDIIENVWAEKLECGDMNAYNSMKDLISNGDLANNAVYEQIKQIIDVESYIYYMATEIFLLNIDWPTNNQKLFRNRNNGKFRWILQDLDKSFNNNNGNKLKELIDSKSTAFPVKMITYLVKNQLFKEQYINSQCLVAGSVYNPSRAKLKVDSIQSKLDSEWQYHAERWGFTNASKNLFHSANEEYKLRFKDLQTAIYNSLSENFNLNKPLVLHITSNEPSAKLTFNGLDIPILPYDGKYFKDKELILTAPAYVNGKKFQFWNILKDGVLSEKNSLSLTLSLKDSITTINAIYDLADSVRRGGLYINEVSASNAIYVDNFFKYEDWIEIYNASDTSLNLAGYFISNDSKDLELFQFHNTDSLATSIPARGYKIIWCSKELQRGVMHTRFKLAKEGGSLFLSKKNKMGVVEIVDSLTYFPHSDDSSFGRYPDGDANMYLFENPTFKATNIATSYNTLIYNQNFSLIYGLGGLTPPVASNMLINGGSKKTADSLVTISFLADESAFMYRLSESPTFDNSPWKLLETKTMFHLSPGFGTKTIYLQLKNARYLSDVISSQVEYYYKYFKVVVGFSGSSTKNVTEVVNEEVLNNTALSLKDTYSALQLYNVWGEPAFKLAKKLSEISSVMTKYEISEDVFRTSTGYDPIFSGNLGVYPDRYYSRAYFFGSNTALSTESRRLIAGFLDVPNGTYDIRILSSQRKETPASDYQSYRYQVNNSDIFIPDSDIFYNNQKTFIEFKNITVDDNTLLVCSWREPFGVMTGYYAPINLIEISESGITNTDRMRNNSESIYIYSGIGKVIIEKSDLLPFTVYSVDGMSIKHVTPESERTEVNLPPGVYIIMGRKAVVF